MNTTNAQRKVSTGKIQIIQTKNARVLGTNSRGNVVDNSDVLDNLALKSEIPTIVAGSNITIDDTDPAQPIISATSSGGGVNIQAGEGIEFDTTTTPGTTIIKKIDSPNALKTEYREVLFSNVQSTDTEIDLGLSSSSDIVANIPKLKVYNGYGIDVRMSFTYTVSSNVGTFTVNDFIFNVGLGLGGGGQMLSESDLSGTLSLGLFDKNGNLVQEQSNISITSSNLVAFSNIDADDTNLAPYSIQLTDNTNLSINGETATFSRQLNDNPLSISNTNNSSSNYTLNAFKEINTPNTNTEIFPYTLGIVFNSNNYIDLQSSTVSGVGLTLFQYLNTENEFPELKKLELVIFYK